MISPMWKAKLCHSFSNDQSSKTLHFEPRDAPIFPKLLALAFGTAVDIISFHELLEIGRMADCYGLTAVSRTVEWEAEQHLTLERAAEVLSSGTDFGLSRLREASREIALRNFEAFAGTAAFLRLSEDDLGSLLEDEGLEAEGEERVLEAVGRWILAGGAGAPEQGGRLLRKVRFGAMGTEYLLGPARMAVPGSAGLNELVGAALTRRAARSESGPGDVGGGGREGPSRRVVAIGWHRYAEGGPAAVKANHCGHQGTVVRQGGRAVVCWGSAFGDLTVTERRGAGIETVRTLQPSGARCLTKAMAAWRGLVVAGNCEGLLQVWDVGAGACLEEVKAHRMCVTGLAVCGEGAWLVSGSTDGAVVRWAAGGGGRWLAREVERDVGREVRCVSSLGGSRVAVGCPDGVLVWNVEGDVAERTLSVGGPLTPMGAFFPPDQGLRAMVVDDGGGRLIWTDGRRIEAWRWDEGALRLVAADAYVADSIQRVGWLAVHGDQLITGSVVRFGEKECELCVRDLRTLELQHVLPFAMAGCHSGVSALFAGRGCVWLAVACRLMVFGHDENLSRHAAAVAAQEEMATDRAESPPSSQAPVADTEAVRTDGIAAGGMGMELEVSKAQHDSVPSDPTADE